MNSNARIIQKSHLYLSRYSTFKNNYSMIKTEKDLYPTLYNYFYEHMCSIGTYDIGYLLDLVRKEEGMLKILNMFLKDTDRFFLESQLKMTDQLALSLKNIIGRSDNEIDECSTYKDREELGSFVYFQFKNNISDIWEEAAEEFKRQHPLDDECKFHRGQKI